MKHLDKIDYSGPIKDYFEDGQSIFICLFPFYRKVFADHYNWKNNLSNTYPLLKSITWKEVSSKTGFNQIQRIAIGILGLMEPFATELNEFCEHEKIDPPDFAADQLPEKVLIPIIEYCKRWSLSNIESKPWDRFPGITTGQFDLRKLDSFTAYERLKTAKHLQLENEVKILLPDYDSPYALIAGNEKQCRKLIIESELEAFEIEATTGFYWWNS